LTLHWSSPTQMCNSVTWRTSHSLPCRQHRLCAVNNYIRPDISPLKWNMWIYRNKPQNKIPESKVQTTVLNDSRSVWGGRLEATHGELWARGKTSFTKPYSSKRGSATLDHIIPSISWDSNGKEQ
jgi:hypothetical protein